MSQTASPASPGQPGEAACEPDYTPAGAEEMQAAMVRVLRDEGAIATGPVAAAFAAVPRHLFAPGESMEAAYAPHGTVMPKRDADGLLVSVLSAPNIQAMMLEPAGIAPGMRVLEVGSGGVNAGYESGVIAHGPHAESLAAQYADLLRRWARDYCRRRSALFRYLPGTLAPDQRPPGAVVKRHGVVTVSWP